MGKTKNSGFAHGTSGSPQQSLEQETLSNKVREKASKYPGVSVTNEDIEYLSRCGVKYDKDSLVFVTRDKSGKPIWLEEGNTLSGLKHILDYADKGQGHADDFTKKFGVSRENIPKFIKDTITERKLISSAPDPKGGTDYIYFYKGGNIKIVIGGNGYIITAHPYSRKEKRK